MQLKYKPYEWKGWDPDHDDEDWINREMIWQWSAAGTTL